MVKKLDIFLVVFMVVMAIFFRIENRELISEVFFFSAMILGWASDKEC